MAEARAVFLAGAPAWRDPLLWPVAALTLVRADADALRFGRWPTRRPMSRTSDGAVSCIGLASALRERESAQARRLLQATGVSSSEIVRTSAFREWLQEQRRLLNAPDGLAVFGLEPTWPIGLTMLS